MGRNLQSSTIKYDADCEQIGSEFEQLKLGHIQRINETNTDVSMSMEENAYELKYEKVWLLEEKKSYSEESLRK